jgi:hypothetical protein
VDPRILGPKPLSFARALEVLGREGVPFLVGGALALVAHCGVRRAMKDLDVFVLRQDIHRALDVLAADGFRTELTFPHWLGKAYVDETRFIDVIFSSGNGMAEVDREWFEHAAHDVVFGVPVAVCPAEETLWSKAFVMERERFDGADVAHLLLSCGAMLDWKRILRRFGPHWRVLFAHLVLFGYAFPEDAQRIPHWVMETLERRLASETKPGQPGVCRGTLLSREQYLTDLERGWRDGRLPPEGTMTPEQIAAWTRAIPASRGSPLVDERLRDRRRPRSSGSRWSNRGATSGAPSSGRSTRRR